MVEISLSQNKFEDVTIEVTAMKEIGRMKTANTTKNAPILHDQYGLIYNTTKRRKRMDNFFSFILSIFSVLTTSIWFSIFYPLKNMLHWNPFLMLLCFLLGFLFFVFEDK